MPTRNSALDRYVKFVPNRILKAQELELAEQLQDTKDIFGIGSVYRDGGTVNVKVTVAGDNVSLDPNDPALPMFVFLNGRFEQITSEAFNFVGVPAPVIFLNWTLWRVTYNDAGTITDPGLVDTSTGERVAEMGQLGFSLSDTDQAIDTTGVGPDVTQFSKNQHTITVYEFERDAQGVLSLKDSYERVKAPALGRMDNAGPVRVTANPPGLALSPFDPYYLQMDVRLKALEAIHPHKDWAPVIADIYARLDAIKIPPPYVPPPEVPFLRIEPESLDFTGMPYVPGTSLQKNFTLINYGEGDGTYELSNLVTQYGFAVIGTTSGNIKAHSAITFTVVFTPQQPYPTPVGGAVQINNDLICTVTGSTRAAANDPVFAFNTTLLDFGDVVTDDFKMAQLTVTNVGAFTGTYQLQLPAGAFTISDDGLNPMSRTLAPGGVAMLQVVYKPTAETHDQVSLSFAQFGKNACTLNGTGQHRVVGPKFQFLTTSASFSVKQGIAAVQQIPLKNVGDQPATPDPYLSNSTDFAIVGYTPAVLQPGGIVNLQLQATAAASGDKSGIVAVRTYGANQCQLSAAVAVVPAPKFAFSLTTRDFGSVATSAGKQTLTVNVTNTGDAPGIPDIVVGQPNAWYNAVYSRSVLNPSASVTVTLEFSPSVDMMAPGYPAINATLSFSGYGLNTCVLSASVTGPRFVITPATADGGIVENGSVADLLFTVQNTGSGTGTVNLMTDSVIQIVGSASFTLAAGASSQFTVRFTASDAVFAAKYPNAAPATLYEFTGNIYGAQNTAQATFRGRSKENRLPRFSPRPNGGMTLFPIALQDVDNANPVHPGLLIYVYNIGNAPGKPTFRPISGDLSYFQITRYGADTEIAPGAYGVYTVTSVGSETTTVGKTARFDLDEGGFQFTVLFTGQPYQTMFCDAFGNRLDDLVLDITFNSAGDGNSGTVYLKRLSTQLAEAAVNTGVDAGLGIHLTATVLGSLNTSSVTMIPVTVHISADQFQYDGNEYSGHCTATGSLNTLRVHGHTTQQQQDNLMSADDSAAWAAYVASQNAVTPGVGQSMIDYNLHQTVYQVFTPNGSAWTTDQSLSGQYIANPVPTGEPGVVTN